MAISDSESDGFGAFDLSEFTEEDFASIDTHIAQHFTQKASFTSPAAVQLAAAAVQSTVGDRDKQEGPSVVAPVDVDEGEESFEFDASFDFGNLTEEDFTAIDSAVSLHFKDGRVVRPEATAASTLHSEAGPSRERGVSEDPTNGVVRAFDENPPPPPPLPKKRSYEPRKAFKKAWADRSLLERYRPSNVLSVSDLTGPVWCEVQFDYGLRQRRSRPIHQRPTSFKTSTGKEIKVEAVVAQQNDVRTKQGQAVHKELEREVRGEVIQIETRSDEERWGLRLLNMIACYNLLLEDGMTREMPVFGRVNGSIIVGIIDEVSKIKREQRAQSESPKRRIPHPSPRKPNKRARQTPPPPQHKDIEEYFTPSPRKTRSTARHNVETDVPIIDMTLPPPPPNRPSTPPQPPPAQYTLHISDTKTRVTDTLPCEEDTQGPQLQVMLYRRLLAALTVPSPDDRNTTTNTDKNFDFPALWAELGVDPDVEFSTAFLVQAGLLEHNEGFPTTNLAGLVKSWEELVRKGCSPATTSTGSGKGVGDPVEGVDEGLELVYRLQPEGMERGKGKGRAGAAGSGLALWRAAQARKVKELEVGLASSERDAGNGMREDDEDQEDLKVEVEKESEARDLAIAIRNSLLDSLNESSSSRVSSSSSSEKGKGKEIEIIDVDATHDADLEMQKALYHSLLPAQAQSTKASSPTTDLGDIPVVMDSDKEILAEENTAPVPLPPEEIDIHGYKIIGRKTFKYDGTLLQNHLDSVFALWRGEREPEGVPVELARRCNTCEYRNGCEWREQKALAAAQGLRDKKDSSKT